jgi:8-oxo-dGTP pyrophosphatase MutT (NUDIX family)
MQNAFLDEPKVQTWLTRATDAGCTVDEMSPLHLVHRKNGELLFGLFHVKAHDPQGTPLLPILLVRGDACVVVPQVRNRDTGEQRYVMVIQRRTGNGQLSLEFPAGMLDKEVDDPLGVMVKELREETGLPVSPSDLFALADRPLYTSVGLQDEAIHNFGCTLELSGAEYESLQGRLTGDAGEGERITVVLRTGDQARAEATSAQVLLALYLFEDALRQRAE